MREQLETLDLLLKVRCRMFNLDKNFSVDAIQVLVGNEPFLHPQEAHASVGVGAVTKAKKKLDFSEDDGFQSAQSAVAGNTTSLPCKAASLSSDSEDGKKKEEGQSDSIEVLERLEAKAYDSDLGTPTSRKLASSSNSPSMLVQASTCKSRKNPPAAKPAYVPTKQTTHTTDRAADISILLEAGYTMAEASAAVNSELVKDVPSPIRAKKRAIPKSPGGPKYLESEICDLTVNNYEDTAAAIDDEELSMTLGALRANNLNKRKKAAVTDSTTSTTVELGTSKAPKSASSITTKCEAKTPTKKGKRTPATTPTKFTAASGDGSVKTSRSGRELKKKKL